MTSFHEARDVAEVKVANGPREICQCGENVFALSPAKWSTNQDSDSTCRQPANTDPPCDLWCPRGSGHRWHCSCCEHFHTMGRLARESFECAQLPPKSLGATPKLTPSWHTHCNCILYTAYHETDPRRVNWKNRSKEFGHHYP